MNSTENETGCKIQATIPIKRLELLRWNGWGYNDTKFEVKDENLYFFSKRYNFGSSDKKEKRLTYFKNWAKDRMNVDIDERDLEKPFPTEFPAPKISSSLIDKLTELQLKYSVENEERLHRSHGQTVREIFHIRLGILPLRTVDLVVWPEKHEDVVELVNLAEIFHAAIIPYGGGTCVNGALLVPETETRSVISVDTSQMNKLLWFDQKNCTACFEAGIIGQDLERELERRGYTCGHEPDSLEFSSLGGWIATRASGMKRSKYGNIEDLVINVCMVTPRGVLIRSTQAPRLSSGPDFNHVIMGSEGTLGIITWAVIKVRPLPQIKKFSSYVFREFPIGLECMYEITKQKCQPASLRLMDNDQFHLGQSLRVEPSIFKKCIDYLKYSYLFGIKKFSENSISVMTLLFEGDKADVNGQEEKIDAIIKRFGGIYAGEQNGQIGYQLTFVIAYIRDLSLSFKIIGDSFETSVPWDKALLLCENVKICISAQCEVRNIKYYMISSRITQMYEQGCCIYFYFGFNYTGFKNPVEIYELIESLARNEIIKCGGSISHHHGIGKIRLKWYPQQVSELGTKLYTAIKHEVDPQNIFGAGNLYRI